MGSRMSTTIYQTGRCTAEKMRAKGEARYGNQRLAKQGEFPPFLFGVEQTRPRLHGQRMSSCRGLSNPSPSPGYRSAYASVLVWHARTHSRGSGSLRL